MEESKYRTKLPVPAFTSNDFSVWSILRQCIGKELSKITMPVIFNEPLSFLQRLTEYMEYAHLLRRAADEDDPVARIEYVTAFAVSALACNWERLGKPFNPLLGETYEVERDDYRVICEQVSHHPPVSAFHTEAPDYRFHGSIHPKLKFWGKSVEILPKGTMHVELIGRNEVYTWTNVNCCVHNIIVGKLWIEQYGTMEVVNHSTGHKCSLTFKPAGWFSKELHRLEGYVFDKNKQKLRYMYGRWTDILKSCTIPAYEEYMKESNTKLRDGESSKPAASPLHSPNTPRKMFSKLNSITTSMSSMSPFKNTLSVDDASEHESTSDEEDYGDYPKIPSQISLDIHGSTLLWEVAPRPPHSAEHYHFTLFAMSLNEMEEGMKEKLCPTDCRIRPDIRSLEEGDINTAAAEKNRLEEKQREARKDRKKTKEKESVPRWFKLSHNQLTKAEEWEYTGGYWDRQYSHVPDIF